MTVILAVVVRSSYGTWEVKSRPLVETLYTSTSRAKAVAVAGYLNASPVVLVAAFKDRAEVYRHDWGEVRAVGQRAD